jgi:hypothetical protein
MGHSEFERHVDYVTTRRGGRGGPETGFSAPGIAYEEEGREEG